MTIGQLAEKTNGKIYVLLSDNETGRRFMEDVGKEGFTFGDGASPASRSFEEIMAVNRDHTVNYVGTNGRIAYSAGAQTVGGLPLTRLDYRLFLEENK